MLKLIFPALCLCLLSNTLSAAIMHPGSLVDGDKYRYAFVTSTTRDATSALINDYDDHVFDAIFAADPTGLGAINWRAWGSTAIVNALEHISTTTPTVWDGTDVPIYLINTSTLIANNFADLTDGAIAASINRTENSDTVDVAVWTGTFSSGIGVPTRHLGVPATFSRAGGSAQGLSNWSSLVNLGVSSSLPLYGFSDVITVSSAATVPEPSSLVLMIFGIGGLGVYRLRHPRRNTA